MKTNMSIWNAEDGSIRLVISNSVDDPNPPDATIIDMTREDTVILIQGLTAALVRDEVN